MSQENVELFHRAVQALNKGDREAFVALMDDDVEAFPRLSPMEGGYHGPGGIRSWWEALHEAFPDYGSEVVEVRDLGNLTLADLRNRAHGADSDAPVEQRSWQVVQWRKKKVVWWGAYGTEEEALNKAAGLSESE